MCGIAGYSLSPESSVKRTLAAQALLAGIAERGADAVGYAHRGSSASVTVHKRRSGASELLDELHVPSASTQVLVHVRDYTKGHPTIEVELQCKVKLNQHRPEAHAAMRALYAQGGENERALAQWMDKLGIGADATTAKGD